MIKEKSFKRHIGFGSNTVGNLRGKIIIISIIFLIIIIIYQTYFESGSQEKTSENDKIPRFLDSTNVDIYPDISTSTDNTSVQMYHPTISINENNYYLVAFEIVEINGTSNIWFSDSIDGENWNHEWVFDDNLENITNPQLKYAREQHFILSFERDGMGNISYSKMGSNWSLPEPGELFIGDKSVLYCNNYLLKANQTGLWFLNYKDFDQSIYNNSMRAPISTSFTNASILKINDYKFIIAHENSSGNFNSIILTTIYLEKPEKTDTVLKWDLLIIFIILGLIFLSMIIQEVAHD